MKNLMVTLALGTILIAGAVSVNALASEGQNDGTEKVGAVTSSAPGTVKIANLLGSEDGNETEDSNERGENESDDGPVTLPVLKPIGPDVLQPLLSKKAQSGQTQPLN